VVTRAHESLFERIVGGPMRHVHDARFAVPFDEQTAARLLAAVRINPDFHSSDPGHSSAFGMTWKAGGSGDVLSVVARPDADGTSVSVVIDRRGTFALTTAATAIFTFLPAMFAGYALAPDSLALGVAGFVVGVGGVLATAHRFWSSSTTRAREKLAATMDAIRQALSSQ
jgi:hypothetical protein